MRPLAVLCVLISSLAVQGCGVNSCQELGNRLCQCAGAGSSRDDCKTAIKNQLSAAGIDDANYAACEAALVTCNAPADASFCEWTNTACAKAKCGLSAESPADPNVCTQPAP